MIKISNQPNANVYKSKTDRYLAPNFNFSSNSVDKTN